MMKKNTSLLVQALAIIAIIAALLALLQPLVINARENAKRKTCASNLRRIASAARYYAQDNEGYFPSGTDGHHYWMFIQKQYLDNQIPPNSQARNPMNVFVCPSRPLLQVLSKPEKRKDDGRVKKWNLVAGVGSAYLFYCSYAINEHVPDEWPRVSDWQAPSKSFHFLEAIDSDIESGELNEKLVQSPDYRLPHNDGLNIAYIDGHVKCHKGVYVGNLRKPEKVKWIFPPDYGVGGIRDRGEWTAPSDD